MGVFHWSQPVGNLGIFQGLGAMFTESVRVGCNFLACLIGLTKYQTCLIFHQPSMILHPDCGFTHLETVLSWLSIACRLHFLSCPTLLLSCLEELPVLSCPASVLGLQFQTDRPHEPTILESKVASCKHNQPDLETSCQDEKSHSLQLWG